MARLTRRNGATGTGSPAGTHACRDVRPIDAGSWVLSEERLLIELKFNGDTELYRAWRCRLWSEMHAPDRPCRDSPDEQYIVDTAFDGDWVRYRICRDHLREVLWRIMTTGDQR
jgi:hypothetical protein